MKKKNESGADGSASTSVKQPEKVHSNETSAVLNKMERAIERADALIDSINRLCDTSEAMSARASSKEIVSAPFTPVVAGDRYAPFGPLDPSKNDDFPSIRFCIREYLLRCYQKKYQDAVSMIIDFYHCAHHNPAIAPELEAMEAIRVGFNGITDLKNHIYRGGKATAAERWVDGQIKDEMTISDIFEVLEISLPLLEENPASGETFEHASGILKANQVLVDMEEWLENL